MMFCINWTTVKSWKNYQIKQLAYDRMKNAKPINPLDFMLSIFRNFHNLMKYSVQFIFWS